MTDFEIEFKRLQNEVNSALSNLLNNNLPQHKLTEAMRYSLLAGGKRIRPILVLSFCIACGGDEVSAINPACALEMLHTYSLIHDDLPCMDNDTLRRGIPTNHVVYGESTATLAGDALQAEAFAEIMRAPVSNDKLVEMCRILAHAAGWQGICGGQTLDIEGEGKALSDAELTRIHSMKTSALLEAACCIGVCAGGGSAEQMKAASDYASSLGLAFQIRDDVLDVIGDEKNLGKPIGSDSGNKKTTFATIYSIKDCEDIIKAETEKAIASIEGMFKYVDFLKELAIKLADRKY